MRTGQISIEYMIITGIVLFLMVIPAAYYLSSFAKNSLYSLATNNKATAGAQSLADSAKQTYYLGLYSKKSVTLEMTDNVARMYILTISVGSKDSYYIVQVLDDGVSKQRFTVQSDVPITADTTPSQKYTSQTPYNQDIPECATNTCTFIEFTQPFTLPGKHTYELETVPYQGVTTVMLTPVLT